MTDLALLNDKIQQCINLINDKFELIDNKIELIEKKVNFMEEKVNNLTKPNEEELNTKNLIKESMNLPFDILKKSLIYKDYRTILLIFKYYYKDKTNTNNVYPIKIKGKRSFEYFNKKWINDTNAHYIKNTLFMNIQTELFKYNNLDNVTEIDEFYNNQLFINKLSEDKDKRNIFKYIIDEISSNE